MTALPLTDALVGHTTLAREVSWDVPDAVLYALAVGAGVESLAFTGGGVTNAPARALPTMATTIGADLDLLHDVDIDWESLVHSEQHLELHQPLTPRGHGTVTSTVTAVWDKRMAAVIEVETVLADADGTPWTTGRASLLVRGAGGWGGAPGPRAARVRPTGAPDHVLMTTLRQDQALLYALTGDDNPLHRDPAFAARAGFDAPILHGLCTFGITARLLQQACLNDDPARVASLAARFAAPVVPGEELRVEAWEADDHITFQTSRSDGTVVLSHGSVVTA